jgi:hypothetical protein
VAIGLIPLVHSELPSSLHQNLLFSTSCSSCCLFPGGFLLGLLFNPEDFSKILVNFFHTTQCYNP